MGFGIWGLYVDFENGVKVVKKVLEYGVNFFDMVDLYGLWFVDWYLVVGLKDVVNCD